MLDLSLMQAPRLVRIYLNAYQARHRPTFHPWHGLLRIYIETERGLAEERNRPIDPEKLRLRHCESKQSR